MDAQFYKALITAPVRAEAWPDIAGVGLFTFATVEVEKWLRFRKAGTLADFPDRGAPGKKR